MTRSNYWFSFYSLYWQTQPNAIDEDSRPHRKMLQLLGLFLIPGLLSSAGKFFLYQLLKRKFPFLRKHLTIRQLTTTELNSLHLQRANFVAELVNTIRCQSTAAPVRSTSGVRVMDALTKACACFSDFTATQIATQAAP